MMTEFWRSPRPVCGDIFTPEAGVENGDRARLTDSGSFPAAGTRSKTENHASSPYYADGEPLSLLTALAGGAMAMIAGAGVGGARARTTRQREKASMRKKAPDATSATPMTPSASQPAFCAPAVNDHRVLASSPLAHRELRVDNRQLQVLASSPFVAFTSAFLGPLGIGLSLYKSPQDPKEVDANNGIAGAGGTCQQGKKISLDPSPCFKSSPPWIVADSAVKEGRDLTRKGRLVILPRSLQRRCWDAVFIFVQVDFAPDALVPFCLVHRQDFSGISPKTSFVFALCIPRQKCIYKSSRAVIPLIIFAFAFLHSYW